MQELIEKLKKNTQIQIKNERIAIKTKTWYSLEEDTTASYIKCELSNNKVLVIIPDDELIYVGSIIENMNYKRINETTVSYNDRVYNKTGDGHQFITKIEFGNEEEVEGRCVFEDYESDDTIISLGTLTDKDNIRADVYAEIIGLEDIKII